MDKFCFAPGVSETTIAPFLEIFGPGPWDEGAILGFEQAEDHQGAGLFVAFASQAMLDLFGVTALEILRHRFFQPADPGFGRLAEIAADATQSLRLARLRFFVNGKSIVRTFWCGTLERQGRRMTLIAEAQAYRSRLVLQQQARPRQEPVVALLADPLPDDMAIVRADLARRFPGERPLRFLWRTDGEHRLVEIGSLLAEVTGLLPEKWVGGPFSSLLRAFDPTAATMTDWIFAACEGVDDLKLAWPIEGRTVAVDIALGGLPRRDAAGNFAGYQGFGLIHKDRLTARLLEPQEEEEGQALSPVLAETRGVIDAGEPVSAFPRTDETAQGPVEGERAARQALEARMHRYESEVRELHAILDTATDGVAVLDAEGRILTLNRSGEALFGYDRGEVLSQPFTMLIAPASRRRAMDYFEGVKTGGVLSLLNDGREIFGLARQGGTIPIFMTLGRIGLFVTAETMPEQGVFEKYCVLLRDMSHWKKIERELEAARKEAERASTLKSDFLAKVSHEIRTPLNAILGFTEVIMDERFGPIGNERYKDYLKDIHMSGTLVMSLVNDLLDLSKIEAGKMDLDFVAVDTNQIIADCVSLMQPQANREGILVRLALAPALPPLLADERSLRQIVLNLLSNAVKFTEPGGQVMVATKLMEDGKTLIRIRDTGAGMSEEEIGIALEPFRQLSTSRSNQGTGLGLPLTKALVEANRASFSISSKKQEGTVVEILFPSARALV
ncbi:sensor histidine kinase [Beijerinckia indica]|uniref:histidine kinase n=1 Tax=Beijerinckia indica subsp. indica (strain ATCC 9039 / DSM 1715 / NCIMB 8712) TaxID=395963 RepID=B2IGE8_BEII9|nr:ATP-binding protein [Beijerinckia indica]ACB94330.1 PAS/PAC sensor signal transduction histidine kinase [Beijerinckia indica subsp. indica ATCC 9039]